MPDKITIELRKVQETLLLPLWGRAVETRKNEPLLEDKTAVEIMSRIDYDFSTIDKNMNPLTRYSWIARSLYIDGFIRSFLAKHPKATIVNIGCGLDTTFERVDNGLLTWYDLDLPDVIELRSHFIQENARRKFIAGSFLDNPWLDALHIEDNIMLVAAGVFYYFDEQEIKDFLQKISGRFPGSEMVFDAASPIGVKMANKTVIKSGGMDENAILKWGLKTAQEIQAWDSRIEVVDEFPMFQRMKKRSIGTFISDKLRIMSMVHLRFS